MRRRGRAPAPGVPDHRRSVRTGLVLGVAAMAAVDEIVFHQILGWHHFYDRSTTEVALLTDGLLHAVELVLLVGGLFLVADLARGGALATRSALGGLLLGAGAFQLFDAVVDHKVLRVHQVRYGVDQLPYDVGWTLSAVVLLAAGALVTRTARRSLETSAREGQVPPA